jgi:4-hydroxy 2-oxovalerate aldolase
VLADFAPMEAVYIADSLGSLRPELACDLVSRFRAALSVPIGFHAHDNQGLALHNSLRVVDAGATWLDATMSGMGRGAGNARMEQLLGVLMPPDTDLQPIHDFVAGYMDPLQKKYGWGANVFYALAGVRHIHPTYVQRLEEAPLRTDEKMRVLRFLSEAPATTFSADRMREAFGNA